MIRELDFLSMPICWIISRITMSWQMSTMLQSITRFFEHVHKIKTIQARAKVKGRRISRLAKPLTRRSVKNEKAKKKDGVIRPFLFGYERSGWGCGVSPLHESVYRLRHLWWCVSAPLDSLRE